MICIPAVDGAVDDAMFCIYMICETDMLSLCFSLFCYHDDIYVMWPCVSCIIYNNYYAYMTHYIILLSAVYISINM